MGISSAWQEIGDSIMVIAPIVPKGTLSECLRGDLQTKFRSSRGILYGEDEIEVVRKII